MILYLQEIKEKTLLSILIYFSFFILNWIYSETLFYILFSLFNYFYFFINGEVPGISLIQIDLSELFFSTFVFCALNAFFFVTPYIFFLLWQFVRPSLLKSEFLLYRKIYLFSLFWFVFVFFLNCFLIFPIYALAFFLFSEAFLNSLDNEFLDISTHIRISDFLNNYNNCVCLCYVFFISISVLYLYKPVDFLFFLKNKRKVVIFLYIIFLSFFIPIDFSTLTVYSFIFIILSSFTEFLIFFMYVSFLLF